MSLLHVGCALRPRTLELYDRDGVKFSYYSDWTVAKDAPLDNRPEVRSIQIHGPNHAVVSLLCLPADTTRTLEQFAHDVAVNRAKKVKDRFTIGPITAGDADEGTSEAATGNISGKTVTGIRQRFQVELLGHPAPHQAEFYLLVTNRYRVFVITQVADRHLDVAQADWKTILDSLQI
jgi:hypothetical protein